MVRETLGFHGNNTQQMSGMVAMVTSGGDEERCVTFALLWSYKYYAYLWQSGVQ